MNDDIFTFQQLISKHSKPSRAFKYFQPTDDNLVTLIINEEDV